MSIKLTFLGTGTSYGVPMIGCRCPVCLSTDPRDTRLRTSALVECQGTRLVVDTGPDFRQQMLRAAVDRLDAVLYTHAHRDHTAGFDELRIFNYLQRRPMDVWCDANTERALRTEFDYVFVPEDERYPGVPEAAMHRAQGPFRIGNLDVEPLEVKHGHLTILGYRFNNGRLVYLTDCSAVPDQTWPKIEGCDVLVVNSVRVEPHASHFSLAQALELIERSGAKRGYLTHASHQLGLHQEVSEKLPRNVELAYDGLEIIC